eukprot:TRINITY_DN19130_c0_g1_i1.p1 TRINITY_DN19130_c0_g1~~TRINITY_DN19130_c0_g1_i1.p1  ORF type:complete len:351 (+),score=-1.36 TRINITY_DN19130_c0_g1_i1:56-1054(+)
MDAVVKNRNVAGCIGHGCSNDYKLGTVVGEGGFARVRICHDALTGKIVGACKTLKSGYPQNGHPMKWLQEIVTLQALSGHRHIVQFKDTYVHHQVVHLIMEHCSGGDLFTYITENRPRICESQSTRILKQILEAVEACHCKGIIHRDVKPENVLISDFIQYIPTNSSSLFPKCELYRQLLDSGNDYLIQERNMEPWIKLADFGSAAWLGPSGYADPGICGSAPYMAPEIILGLRYSSAVDMWSIGVTAFFLLLGTLPFQGNTVHEVLCSILNGGHKLHEVVDGKVSEEAWDFLRHLLCFHPEDRFTATEALRHPWIQNAGRMKPAKFWSPSL